MAASIAKARASATDNAVLNATTDPVLSADAYPHTFASIAKEHTMHKLSTASLSPSSTQAHHIQCTCLPKDPGILKRVLAPPFLSLAVECATKR